MLIDLLHVMSRELTEVASSEAEIRQLEDCRRTKDAVGRLLTGFTRVDDLTAEHTSLAVGAEQAQAEHDVLVNRSFELEHGKLSDIIEAVRSLKELMVKGKISAGTVENMACKTSDKIS